MWHHWKIALRESGCRIGYEPTKLSSVQAKFLSRVKSTWRFLSCPSAVLCRKSLVRGAFKPLVGVLAVLFHFPGQFLGEIHSIAEQPNFLSEGKYFVEETGQR